MRLSEAARPVFARHETFHPRYGWFRKAYEATADDPAAFTRKDAPVELGVGKNMVKSIRFWGSAAKLIQDHPDSPHKRATGVAATRFGTRLFDPESGWDPFMEDPGTLWLLHWQLLAPPCLLPVWWVAFNQFHAVEFDIDELETACMAGIDSAAEWPRPHRSSVRKDVTALLRTYAPAERSARTSVDDLLDCPLRELGMIAKSAATGRYRFTMGAKPTLPPAVVAYAALDFAARTDPASKTALLSRLAGEPGSPGRAFKLTEDELADALRAATAESQGRLALASPAGAAQLAWNGDPEQLGLDLLGRYFDQCRSHDASASAGSIHLSGAAPRVPAGAGAK
ncbi:MAG: DUF4007 family protein [bacterium]|nr:DUF4007 family protein [bacterium]